MTKSSIVIDLDDPRSDRIADAISNKTSKKILSVLAEKEMSGSEVASKLNLPINTVTYNLKNLVASGLIEKTNRIFWSAKGKKMEIYKISNKRIVISPKSMIKGIIPALIFSLIFTVIIAFTFSTSEISQTRGEGISAQRTAEDFVESDGNSAGLSLGAKSAPNAKIDEDSFDANLMQENYAEENSPTGISSNLRNPRYVWAWYLFGALIALGISVAWNMRRNY